MLYPWPVRCHGVFCALCATGHRPAGNNPSFRLAVCPARARDSLFPSRMSLLDRLFSVGKIRKAIWRWWYPYVTKRLRNEEVLFLNYAFETDPPAILPLAPEDEPNRASIQL